MPTLVNDKPQVRDVAVADIARNIVKNLPGLAQASGRVLAQEELNRVGASVGAAASVLRDIMMEGQDDHVKHKAAMDVMKIHGATDGDKAGGDFNIQFNFHGGSVNLQQILCPDRMTAQDAITESK